MKSSFSFFISFFLLASYVLSASIQPRSFTTDSLSQSHPQAKLNLGLAIGRTLNGIDSWRGIPYAQKPIGSLRLMPPVAISAQEIGVEHFDRDPNSCINVNSTASTPSKLTKSQNDTLNVLTTEALSTPSSQVAMANYYNSTALQSEDCLYLNLHRPQGTNSDSRLPVIIFIYGGSFIGSDITQYRPEQLLKRSVELDQPIIYVHMNYRLGAYGFLSGADVLKSSRANLGLRDQAMAIEWVHDNIVNFGGDPSKVTIWGQSAGSMSVGLQLLKEGKTSSEGRFRSAIMESGSPYHFPNASTFDVAYAQMVSSTGCDQSNNPFKCLQELEVSIFNKAMNAVVGDGRLPFAPAVDSDFLPDYPEKLLVEGKYNQDVVIINGDQEDEGTILALPSIPNIVDEQDFEDFLRASVPDLKDSEYQKIKELYPNNTVGSPYGSGELYQITTQNKRIASALGDFSFQYPRRQLLNQVSKTNPAVFSYIQDAFANTPLLGSYHGISLVNSFGWMNGTTTTKEMTARWIGFVNNQKPDAKGYSKFPVYKAKEKKLLWFGNETSWVEKDDFRQEQTDYLQKVIADRG